MLGLLTPFASWRVLVAAGNRGDAKALVRELRRYGHAVTCVGTGTATLQSFEDSDLVLLDLDFPDLDGLEVCRGIRSFSNIPMIAVTSRGTELLSPFEPTTIVGTPPSLPCTHGDVRIVSDLGRSLGVRKIIFADRSPAGMSD